MEMACNPKNTKQEIKLVFFYILDGAIIALMLVLASYMLKMDNKNYHPIEVNTIKGECRYSALLFYIS